MDRGYCLYCFGYLLLFSLLNDWEQLVCMAVTSHPPPKQQATHIPLNTWGDLWLSSIFTLFTHSHSKMWLSSYFVLVLSMGLNIGLALGFALGFWEGSSYSACFFFFRTIKPGSSQGCIRSPEQKAVSSCSTSFFLCRPTAEGIATKGSVAWQPHEALP